MARTYDAIVRELLDRHVAPGSRVLDIGCGTGWTALLLSRAKPGCRITGVDLDELAIHRANARFRRVRRAGLGACVLCAAEELGARFRRGSFDCAVMNLVIHHLANPFRALRQTRLVLRRGGALLITDYEPRYGERLDDCPRYSLGKLRELVGEAGFRIRRAKSQPPGVLTLAAERP